MTRLQTIWAALKAQVSAVILVMAIGFLFAGTDKAMVWLFLDYCTQTRSSFCRIPGFWSAWWWFIFLVLVYPLYIAFLVIFVRKFARPGYRLVSTGFVCAFNGFWMILNGFSAVADESNGVLIAVYIAIGAILLLAGLHLGLRRVTAA